jgi:AraC-like DNA-binding protein
VSDRNEHYLERDYSAEDLAKFDVSDAIQGHQRMQAGTAFGGKDAMVTGLLREHEVIPGLTVMLMDGKVLGEFTAPMVMPAGLKLYVGFKANGHTQYGSVSLPHQTLPGVLCMYSPRLVEVTQTAYVGPYQTLSIHFEDAAFNSLLDTHCLDATEKTHILRGLTSAEPGHFWHPGAESLEGLHSLIYTELTGINLNLFVHQAVMGLLRAFINHISKAGAHTTTHAVSELQARDIRKIERAARYVEQHLEARLTQAHIARAVGVSGQYLKLNFPRLYGDSIAYYVLKTRMNNARIMLASGGMTIQQVAAAVGYASQASFTTAFRKYHSMTPREAINAL